MPTHLAFLRAVNLGARRKLPMADLREHLEALGYGDVATYIQTGNLRVTSPLRSRTSVEAELERVLAEHAGFEVPTVVRSPRELTEVHAAATSALEEAGVRAQRRYVTFLKSEPTAEVAAWVDTWEAPGEGARLLGREVLWWTEHPTQASRLSNAVVERRLGVATTRDLKVVATLAERWGA